MTRRISWLNSSRLSTRLSRGRAPLLYVSGLWAMTWSCSEPATPGPGAGSGGETSSTGTGGASAQSGGADSGSGSGGLAVVGSGGVASGGSSPGVGGTGVDGTGGSGGAAPSNCTPQGKARNPLVGHIFTADPNAVVYGDKIYVYTSHDTDGQTNFDLIDYHAYSSDDMVNWQDHGVIIKAQDVQWATNLYAPGACEKGGKYYLYMPNSGSGVGVAVADDPGGPFVDPLGVALVTPSTPGVSDVDWLFDPACFVDEDGQGYLYFGGGPQDSGDNARVMRLGDDMISLKDTSATTIVARELFEASFMHKRGDTYYFSYSSNFKDPSHSAYIDYLTSDNPMTGFVYKGSILANSNINMGNNNHHSIVDFMGKSYLFYHNRKLEQDRGGNNEYQRSIAVQELTYNADGSIAQQNMSTDDTTVAQIKCLDGKAEVQAERMAAQGGIEVEGNGATGVHIVDIDDEDWIGYSQVDFHQGTTRLVARVAAAAAGGSIEIWRDGCEGFTEQPGQSVGTCQVQATGGADTFAELSCDFEATSGPHDLCLKFVGDGSFKLDSFHLE